MTHEELLETRRLFYKTIGLPAPVNAGFDQPFALVFDHALLNPEGVALLAKLLRSLESESNTSRATRPTQCAGTYRRIHGIMHAASLGGGRTEWGSR